MPNCSPKYYHQYCMVSSIMEYVTWDDLSDMIVSELRDIAHISSVTASNASQSLIELTIDDKGYNHQVDKAAIIQSISKGLNQAYEANKDDVCSYAQDMFDVAIDDEEQMFSTKFINDMTDITISGRIILIEFNLE